ncbi:MAG: tRNA1(Val) (adenine(37)-N6)-methyltransferase [Clostridia bacterium]
MLKTGERLDDLQINGLKIIQNSNLYCFTSDAVLLANTVNASANDRVCDLCSGSGIIAMLIASKRNAREVVGVELQAEMADMAQRSVDLNNLGDKVKILQLSAQDAPSKLGYGSFDIVVANPPYGTVGTGRICEDERIAICKNEIKLTLNELVLSASKLTKFGGKFYMIHRADRLAEIIFALKMVSLEPKAITIIYPKADKTPDTFIVECINGGKPGLILKSLTVYEHNNTYTAEAKKLYSIS